jgi:hypothetical protein
MSIEVKEFEDRKEWYLDGVLHREDDLPAIEYTNTLGAKEWWKNGKLHRDGDLPAVEFYIGLSNVWYKKGLKWYKNGERHRDGDLPAVEYSNGAKWWFKNDLLHRDNGLPAFETPNGNNEWWWFGRNVSRKEALELSNKYNQAIQTIKNFRSRVKRYSAMCGLTPKKFQRVLGVLHKKEFCEWWWHPDNPGGKNHLRNMEKMFNKWGN